MLRFHLMSQQFVCQPQLIKRGRNLSSYRVALGYGTRDPAIGSDPLVNLLELQLDMDPPAPNIYIASHPISIEGGVDIVNCACLFLCSWLHETESANLLAHSP